MYKLYVYFQKNNYIKEIYSISYMVENIEGGSPITPTIEKGKNFQENTHDESIFKKNYGFYFHTKSNALDELLLYNDNNLHLFSFDITNKTNDIVKAFIVRKYNEIYKILVSNPLKNIYENFEGNNKVKLFIDLDYKFEKHKEPHYSFNELCNAAIESVCIKLKNFNIINPSIIILSANTTEKLSAHIIFPDIVFESINHLKYFMTDIDSDLIDNDIFDLAVYKVGSFRTFLSSKYGKENHLTFHSSINYKKKKDYDLFFDTLLTNCHKINVIDFKIPEIIKSKPNIYYKDVQIKNFENDNYVSLDRIKQYLDIINIDRGKKYQTWFEVAKTLFNCNTNSIELFIEWSRKVPGYENTSINNYIKLFNSLKPFPGGIENLRRMAKCDNPDRFRQIEYSIEVNSFESIKFSKQYLLMDNDTNDDILRNNLNIFITNSNTKSLSIKSPYDTGKTTLIKHILDKNIFKRVLFITYRKTLTTDIFGSLLKYNFESYLDGNYLSNRFICQVDSLIHLSDSYETFRQTPYPEYDLIILDEIESTLNHFSATTLQKKPEVYNILKSIIKNSNKFICLDGDFSNRGYDFVKLFGESIILENTIKKNLRQYIFHKNKDIYDNLLDNDLKNKKNICIVSMSSKIAESYYEKYNKTYKCCIHTGLSDDSDLEKLKDVNKLWKDFQLIIYSPTIESGVNFDTEHIDNIYCVLSGMSTSPRGLNQMLYRVRKIKNNKINIFLNGLPYSDTAAFYTFNETKDHVIGLAKDYLTKEDVLDEETKKISRKYIYDDYVNLIVHNKKEELNKSNSLFVPYLIELFKLKGHVYQCPEENRSVKLKIDDTTLEEIYHSTHVTNNSINELIQRKLSGDASKEDKLRIEKYVFRKLWKIDYFECDKENDNIIKTKNDIVIDKEFFTNYFRKSYILLNLRNLLNKEKIDVYNNFENTLVLDFNKAEMNSKLEIIKKIIIKLGFDLNNMDITLDKDTFTKNLDNLEKDYELFKNEQVKVLFGFNKNKLTSIKSYMGFINTILKDFGINIISKKTSKRTDGQIINYNKYLVEYLKEYHKYF